MKILLDTCILSEFTRHAPSPVVVRWMDEVDEEDLALSVITLGEIQRGIERLPDSKRKTNLILWLKYDLVERFSTRILSLDLQTMLIWGSLTARMENIGRPLPVMDSLIAATALRFDLVIATRNRQDFLPSGVEMINPWE